MLNGRLNFQKSSTEFLEKKELSGHLQVSTISILKMALTTVRVVEPNFLILGQSMIAAVVGLHFTKRQEKVQL